MTDEKRGKREREDAPGSPTPTALEPRKKAKSSTSWASLLNQDSLDHCLFLASSQGEVAEVADLIEGKANIERRFGHFEQTPLHIASQNGHVAVVNQLISARAAVDNRDRLLPGANIFGFAYKIKRLHITALYYAAGMGRTPVVKALISARADVQLTDSVYPDDGWQPIHIASVKGHMEVIEVLLEQKVDINTRAEKITGNTVTDFGVSYGAYYERGNTPLHIACSENNQELVAFLLAKKAKVTARNSTGKTALHLAIASYDRTSAPLIVKALIEAKADVKAKDKEGDDALHKLCNDYWVGPFAEEGESEFHSSMEQKGRGEATFIQIAKPLLKANADLDGFDDNGFTPLMLAAQHKSAGVVSFLVDAKADVRLTSEGEGEDGFSAIHYASRENATEVIKRLLDAKVDVNVVDRQGNTPLHIASAERNHDAFSVLLQRGADWRLPNRAELKPQYVVADPDSDGNAESEEETNAWRKFCSQEIQTQQRMALLGGLHQRLGARSILGLMDRKPTFDRQTLRILFKLAAPTVALLKQEDEEPDEQLDTEASMSRTV